MAAHPHLSEAHDEDETRYILFDVGAVRLATPLLDVREIVEPIPYQNVPNPFPPFLGLANLRGQIIGIIDFGLCLDQESIDGSSESKLIVFDGGDTKLGILVSQVHSSLPIAREEIVSETLVRSLIPTAALIGMAKIEKRIVPIVSLSDLALCLPELGKR